MNIRAQRRLWLALWAVALAVGCNRGSSEAPPPVSAPPSQTQKAQALVSGTCNGVEPTSMAPGWKLDPLQATGASTVSASFASTVGEHALLVVRETTGASGPYFQAAAKLNGSDKVSITQHQPLGARVVPLRATNGLELAAQEGGTARASVASLSQPPCAAVEARVTHAGGTEPTVETRTFAWPADAGPALLVVESSSGKKVQGRVRLGITELAAPQARSSRPWCRWCGSRPTTRCGWRWGARRARGCGWW